MGRAADEHAHHVDGLHRVSAAAPLRRRRDRDAGGRRRLFGMALVPFVYWSVNIWRTMHPTTNVVPTLPAPACSAVLLVLVAFTLLFAALLTGARAARARAARCSRRRMLRWRTDVKITGSAFGALSPCSAAGARFRAVRPIDRARQQPLAGAAACLRRLRVLLGRRHRLRLSALAPPGPRREGSDGRCGTRGQQAGASRSPCRRATSSSFRRCC